jgi:hypothetical protein
MDEGGPPHELVCAPTDPERLVAPLRKATQTFIVAAIAGAIPLVWGMPYLAVGPLLAATLWSGRVWRRARDVRETVLRITGGELEVAPRGSTSATTSLE